MSHQEMLVIPHRPRLFGWINPGWLLQRKARGLCGVRAAARFELMRALNREATAA